MGRRKILETNFSTEQIIYKKIKELKNGICTIDQRTALTGATFLSGRHRLE